jgi:chemotaxis protein CheD
MAETTGTICAIDVHGNTGRAGKIIVDIADLKVSDDPGIDLITYSLGSCIGVTIWDSVARVGGLLHYMLPDSAIKPTGSAAMFADKGIPLLFKSAYALGAVKRRMIVTVAGGSSLFETSEQMDIGRHNYVMLRKIFWRNGVLIEAEHVGGDLSRTMKLSIGTGEVTIDNHRTGTIVLQKARSASGMISV